MKREIFIAKMLKGIDEKVAAGHYGSAITAPNIDGRHLTAILDLMWAQGEGMNNLINRLEKLEKDYEALDLQINPEY